MYPAVNEYHHCRGPTYSVVLFPAEVLTGLVMDSDMTGRGCNEAELEDV